MCAASAFLFASHKLRSAVAADRLSAGSVSADTTYVSTVSSKSGAAGFDASSCACVENQEEYAPI